jgi:hypothetical protein
MSPLEFLVENGYCDTPEAAELVYDALSEGARSSIVAAARQAARALVGSAERSEPVVRNIGKASKWSKEAENDTTKYPKGTSGVPNEERRTGATSVYDTNQHRVKSNGSYSVDTSEPRQRIYRYGGRK